MSSKISTKNNATKEIKESKKPNKETKNTKEVSKEVVNEKNNKKLKEVAKEVVNEKNNKKSKEVAKEVAKEATKEVVNEKNNKKSNNVKESSKEKNNKKSEEVKDVNKPSVNKDTEESGCHFNVNITKTWMKTFFSRPEYEVSYAKKLDKDSTDSEKIIITKQVGILKGTYCCLTGINEVLISSIINLAGKKAKRDSKSELIKITEENIIDVIRLDNVLNKAFGHFISDFDSTQVYQKELNINKKEFNTFIETQCMHGNSTVTLEQGAFNFVMFILRKIDTLLCDCTFQMARCYGKTQINDRSIFCALKIIIPSGELQKSMLIKADDITKRKKEKSLDKKDKKDKSDTKNKNNKNNKNNNDDDDDDDDDEDDDEDDDGDNDDDVDDNDDDMNE